MVTYYVYELRNPDNEIFYIGKGTDSGRGITRLNEHLKDARAVLAGKHPSNHRLHTINQIIAEGKLPTIHVVFTTSKEELALQKEVELIKQYGRKDIGTGILTNHTDGGEGNSGYQHSITHRAKLRENNAGGNARAKEIRAICPITGSETTYKSCRNAAISLGLTEKANANISFSATKKPWTTVYGYYWRYIGDSFSIEEVDRMKAEINMKTKRPSTPLVQKDMDGNVIKTWVSIRQAAIASSVSASTLRDRLKRNKEWNGYIWEFMI